MRSISRTFVWSKCSGQRYIREQNEFVDFNDILLGEFTPERATKKLQRIHKDSSILIVNVELEKHYYKMSAKKFLEEAERVY